MLHHTQGVVLMKMRRIRKIGVVGAEELHIRQLRILPYLCLVQVSASYTRHWHYVKAYHQPVKTLLDIPAAGRCIIVVSFDMEASYVQDW